MANKKLNLTQRIRNLSSGLVDNLRNSKLFQDNENQERELRFLQSRFKEHILNVDIEGNPVDSTIVDGSNNTNPSYVIDAYVPSICTFIGPDVYVPSICTGLDGSIIADGSSLEYFF